MATVLKVGGASEDGSTLGRTSTEPVGLHGLYCAQAAHITNPVSTYSTTWTTTTEVANMALLATEVAAILTALENCGILAKS